MATPTVVADPIGNPVPVVTDIAPIPGPVPISDPEG